MACRFSIILPIYNVEAYLQRGFNSVIEQTFDDYEVILVDDGSTDSSGTLADFLAKGRKNVSVVHKKNGGLSSARNAGLEIANGEYIFFMDSDDWISHDLLERVNEFISHYDPDIVKFGYTLHPVGDIKLPCVTEGLYTGDTVKEQLLEQAFSCPASFILSAWSSVYSKDFLKKNQLIFVSEREVGSEDYLFNLEALSMASSVGVIRSSFYFYDFREGSLTHKYRNRLAEQYTELHRVLCEYYRKNNNYQTFKYMINKFYIYNLMFNTVFTHELNTITEIHSYENAVERIKTILRTEYFKNALVDCRLRGMDIGDKKNWFVMRFKLIKLIEHMLRK